jgi:hypothetical protein
MKSYPEKNELNYFIFAAISENLSRQTDTRAVGSSDGLEDFGFNVMNVRQITTTRITSNGRPTWNPSLYLLLR